MYNPLTVLPELVKKNENKIVLLVIDGVGGLPFKGKTALELADTPNLDEIASLGSAGLIDPVFPGITPGSGPAHLSLFGYDPLEYRIGRGILEALGVGMEVGKNDITARGNFCVVEDGVVTDRRAGRISTEINEKLVDVLNSEIKELDGIEVTFKSGKEHRFVLRLRGKGLNDEVSDTDPHKAGEKLMKAESIEGDEESSRTADLINRITELCASVLNETDETPNAVLLRGVSAYPPIPQFPDVYKLKALSIATYPMYRGLTSLVGMDVVEGLTSEEQEIAYFEESYDRYDYFYIHIKKVDSYGEDGNFDKKVEKIELADSLIPRILSKSPGVLAVTGDHSTPATYKSHSWHPVPFILKSRWTRISNIDAFSESECLKGDIGRIPALYVTSLLLAHAERLDKFGA